MRLHRLALGTGIVVAAATTPTFAHHEAIYGAYSALGVSSDRYVSAQLFARTTGPEDERVRETTTVLSGGIALRGGPVSLSVVVPFSVLAGEPGRSTRVGLENTIVAGRYRLNLPGVNRVLGTEESYVLGVGGVEVPTGTVDHGFFEGAPALVSGLTLGLERRPVSVIGYVYLNRYAERDGVRDSGNTFVGAGVAWTPVDDEPNGRLFSLQFGISRDSAAREIVGDVAQDATGGWAVVAHPAIVWSTRPGVLWFVSTALPMRDGWRDPGDRERFRVGAGAIVSLLR